MNARRRFDAGLPPCGWIERPVPGGFGLRRESGRTRIEAVRNARGGEPPRAIRGRRWELRRRRFAGEASDLRTIRIVETREQAIEALYDYAERAGRPSARPSAEPDPPGRASGGRHRDLNS